MIRLVLCFLIYSTCLNFIQAQVACNLFGTSWSYTEIVDWTTHTRIIRSNYCPNHFSACQSPQCSGGTASISISQNVSFQLPLYPDFAAVKPDTTCTQDTIAIALNGVPIRGMSTGEKKCIEPGSKGWTGGGSTSCSLNGEDDGILECGDIVVKDGNTFDKCGGVTDSNGLYHYNIAPVCLIQQLELSNLQNKTTNVTNVLAYSTLHGPQIGWALDGFPVYGPYGINGLEMHPCESAAGAVMSPFCLDGCNGLRLPLPGVDDFLYRYYIAGPLGSGECSVEVSAILVYAHIFDH